MPGEERAGGPLIHGRNEDFPHEAHAGGVKLRAGSVGFTGCPGNPTGQAQRSEAGTKFSVRSPV